LPPLSRVDRVAANCAEIFNPPSFLPLGAPFPRSLYSVRFIYARFWKPCLDTAARLESRAVLRQQALSHTKERNVSISTPPREVQLAYKVGRASVASIESFKHGSYIRLALRILEVQVLEGRTLRRGILSIHLPLLFVYHSTSLAIVNTIAPIIR